MTKQATLFPVAPMKPKWRTLYTRSRKGGERLSVAVPPDAEGVLVRVTKGGVSRGVLVLWDEVDRVADALRSATEAEES